MKYLIETTEIYRVDSEDEAKTVIEDAKRHSTVSKYDCSYREKKQKGEVIDSWYKVSIKKKWTDEKEPDSSIAVSYKVETAWEDNDEN